MWIFSKKPKGEWRDPTQDQLRRDEMEHHAEGTRRNREEINRALGIEEKVKQRPSYKIPILSNVFNAVTLAGVLAIAVTSAHVDTTHDGQNAQGFDTENSQEMTRPVPRPKGLGD